MLGKAPAPVANHLWPPKRLDPEFKVPRHHCNCTRRNTKWAISCSLSQKSTANKNSAAAAAYDLIDDFIVVGATKNDSSVVHDSPETNITTIQRDNEKVKREIASVSADQKNLKVQALKGPGALVNNCFSSGRKILLLFGELQPEELL